jgi:hypothetical protein
MPRGLAIPVGVNTSGGARTVVGDENDSKILKLGLGDDENDNAYQQGIGLGTGMIFDTLDVGQRAQLTQNILDLFVRWEAQKRYKLRSNTVRWEEEPESGDLILVFKYVSLEADEERLFRRRFVRAGES